MLNLLLLLLASDPQSYMTGEYYRSDCYPRDGLVADWNFMDANVEGDLLGGLGDMESGSASGGCTYCPSGFTCACTATSNNTQETSKVYKNGSSLNNTIDGSGNAANIAWVQSFDANAAYQVSFRYKGNVGGSEDFTVSIRNAVATDYYDFATDTWGGAAFATYTNIASSWSTATLYVNVGAAPKAGYYVYMAGSSASQTIYFDDLQIRKLKSTGPRSQVGGYVLTPPVTGDPRFGDSEVLQGRKGTGPAVKNGTQFKDSSDYLSMLDASWQEASLWGGSASYACRFIPDSTSANDIFNKNSAGQLSWELYQAPAFTCYVSKDGTNSSLISSGVSATAGQQTAFLCTYQQVADGSSVLTAYANNSSANISNAVAPIYNGTSPLYVAANGSGNGWSGNIGQCSIYKKDLSSTEASKWINPYYCGSNNSQGTYVTTCTQSASHATCSAQKCRDGTPGACQAEGTGAMAVFGQYTELVPYNSFETVVGDDSSPTFTGWTADVIPGDGTASWTAYRDDTKHGNIATRAKLTGTTSYVYTFSSCITVSGSTAYYPYAAAKALIGSPSVTLAVFEYTGGACTGFNGGTNRITTLSNQWQDITLASAVTTQPGTNSAYVSTYVATSASTRSVDVLIDAVSLKAATYHTPWVHNSGAGSTTHNARDYRLRNKLADAVPGGTYPYATGWCASMWVYDWCTTGSGSRYLLNIPGTAGSNNTSYSLCYLYNGNYYIEFTQFDGAGNYEQRYRQIDGTSWTSGDWKFVEICTDDAGNQTVHHWNRNNSTWYPWSTASGAMGSQTAQSTTLNLGASGSGTLQLDGYISNFCFKPYNAAYTGCGFNNGIPPINGRPY